MDIATTLAYNFVQRFNEVILFPTIALLSAVALLVFMYGCFLYIVRAADPAARTQGVQHITWGIVGMVVMLSAYTIMSIFAGTLGLRDELDTANVGGVVIHCQAVEIQSAEVVEKQSVVEVAKLSVDKKRAATLLRPQV